MRILKWFGLGVASLLVIGAALLGVAFWQGMAERSDGLQIGARAPDFALVSQAGETVRLSELLANGPVAVLFYRSADW